MNLYLYLAHYSPICGFSTLCFLILGREISLFRELFSRIFSIISKKTHNSYLCDLYRVQDPFQDIILNCPSYDEITDSPSLFFTASIQNLDMLQDVDFIDIYHEINEQYRFQYILSSEVLLFLRLYDFNSTIQLQTPHPITFTYVEASNTSISCQRTRNRRQPFSIILCSFSRGGCLSLLSLISL